MFRVRRLGFARVVEDDIAPRDSAERPATAQVRDDHRGGPSQRLDAVVTAEATGCFVSDETGLTGHSYENAGAPVNFQRVAECFSLMAPGCPARL